MFRYYRNNGLRIRPSGYSESLDSISSQELLGKLTQHFIPGITGKPSPNFRPKNYWLTIAGISPQKDSGKIGLHFVPRFSGEQLAAFRRNYSEKITSISSEGLLATLGQHLMVFYNQGAPTRRGR